MPVHPSLIARWADIIRPGRNRMAALTRGGSLGQMVRAFSASVANNLSHARNGGPVQASFDVAIIGAGLVGSTLACALAPHSADGYPWRICLIDKSPITVTNRLPSTSFSNLTVSLTPSTVSFLEDIGVWRHVDDCRTHDYQHIEVWDSESTARISFDCGQVGMKHLATIIERHNLQNALTRRLEELDSLTIVPGATVQEIQRQPLAPGDPFPGERPQIVRLGDDRSIRANVVVGADGINSVVRKAAGIDVVGWDYGQRCVVATLEVECDGGPNDTAWQRFLPTGPIALLPQADDRASLAWSISTHYANILTSLNHVDLGRMINIGLNYPTEDLYFMLDRLAASKSPVDIKDDVAWRWESLPKSLDPPPKVIAVDPDYGALSYPLRMRHATKYFESNGLVLVGDAAHVIHPLAGQGLNLGMSDARALHDAFNCAAESGQPLYDPRVLGRYASERYLPNLALMSGVDTLNWVFGSQWTAPIRSLATNLANTLPGLKNLMVQAAVGRQHVQRA